MSSAGTALALENVLYEKKGAVAYVTLNRPKVLNALNRQTWEDLRTAFEDARDDAEIRGVILTGAGEKAFIAGADIGELAQITAVDAEQSSTYGQEVLDLVENLGKPVIADFLSIRAGLFCIHRGNLSQHVWTGSPRSGGESRQAGHRGRQWLCLG